MALANSFSYSPSLALLRSRVSDQQFLIPFSPLEVSKISSFRHGYVRLEIGFARRRQRTLTCFSSLFFFSSDFVLWFGSLCEFPCYWCWLYCVLLIELLFGGNRRLDFLFLQFFLYCFLLLIVIYFDLLVRASWGLDDLICAICFVLTAVINWKILVVHSFVYLDTLTNLMIIYILNWGLDYLLFAILIGSDDLMIVIFYKFRWFCSWNSCSFLLFLYTAAVN